VIPSVFTAKVTAIVGTAALVIGFAAGGYAAHLFYAPRLEVAELKIETLGEDIRRQNLAVDQLRKDGEARAAKAAAAIKDAENLAAQAEADAQNLLMMQPKPGENRCDAASALIRKELGR